MKFMLRYLRNSKFKLKVRINYCQFMVISNLSLLLLTLTSCWFWVVFVLILWLVLGDLILVCFQIGSICAIFPPFHCLRTL